MIIYVKTQGDPKKFYGHMIKDGIATKKPGVVQYAYAFALTIIYT